MNWVEIISAVLGLSCVFLAGRNSKYNFWVGYVYNVFLLCLFWKQHLYCAMMLQPVAFAINIFGHYRWTHPAEGEKSADDEKKLKVSSLSKEKWAMLLVTVCVAALTWGFFLKGHSDDPSPWLDSFILMTTFLAQYLSAQKCYQCWFVWLAINAANIVLYISAGLVLMPVVSALYLANGVWSLISWKKMYKNEQ